MKVVSRLINNVTHSLLPTACDDRKTRVAIGFLFSEKKYFGHHSNFRENITLLTIYERSNN